MKRKHLKYFLLTAFVMTISFLVIARPGGGHSFSSGRSFGGGYGGYGGGGGDILWILYLLPPEISIPLVIIIVLFVMFRRQSRSEDFTMVSAPTAYNVVNNNISIARQIAAIKALDHNFSRVLFLDFVASLYTKFYVYQSDKKRLSALNPFFDASLLSRFIQDKVPLKVSEIVIGGMRIEKVAITGEVIKIFVRIKSNMTIEANGQAMRYIVDDRWTLARDKNVLSPEPEKMHVVSCPACGAPADFNDAGYCNSCGTLIRPGKMQWYVVDRKVFDFSVFHTTALLTYVQEQGTDLPTVYDPYLRQRIDQFCEIHGVQWPDYQQKFISAVVQPTFEEIYKAWSTLQWNKVRHILSDRLWESYNFWIQAYKQHGWRNMLDVSLQKVEVVRVELDRFYEAVTVRIFASGLDYVADSNGKVLAGSKRIPRRFSEYWTFIRRTGVERDDISLHRCPACGAPADKIGQSGICEYCGNKITWGDFSWILAIITQDEEYGY